MTNNEKTESVDRGSRSRPDELAHASRQVNGSMPLAQALPAKAVSSSHEPPTVDLNDLMAERDDLVHRLQRLAAEYVNYQKRIQREIEQAREFANEEIIKALLPVLDDIDRALQTGTAVLSREDPFLIGLKLVQEKMMAILERFGLTAIESLDKPFNPDCHCAVATDDSGQHPTHTVIQELRRGYALKGRALRPTLAIVSVPPRVPCTEGISP